jgi:glycosyltransferase involved in cell wall biosynthesis
MSHLRFSLVTVSFNQVGFLEECIRSVLSQEARVEYIVMDGGSDDGSAEMIASFDKHLSYWSSGPDLGPANALNKGFDQATGDFIGYINSDDYLVPGALNRLEEVISRHPGYDVYYGPGYLQDEINDRRFIVWPTKWNLGVYRSGQSVMFQQSIFIRRAFLEERNIRFSEENTTHWDGEHLVDLDLAGARFFRHGIPIGVFRIHGASLTGGAQGARWQQKYREQIERLNDRIDREHPDMIRSRAYWLAWLLVNDPFVMVRRVYRKTLGRFWSMRAKHKVGLSRH